MELTSALGGIFIYVFLGWMIGIISATLIFAPVYVFLRAIRNAIVRAI